MWMTAYMCYWCKTQRFLLIFKRPGSISLEKKHLSPCIHNLYIKLLRYTEYKIYLSFFLSIYTGSLIHEHYTRECEFGNFDKIKNKNNTKKQNNTKKHKNFWLNFCLNRKCPKLLCGLGICHRRRQTIPMWNTCSSGEKGNLQGITVCLVSAVLSTMWWPGSF